MTAHYAFLVLVALIAGGAALLKERRQRIALASIAAAVAAIGIVYGVYQERQAAAEAQRQYVLSLEKEVSAAQYVTIQALVEDNDPLTDQIKEAFEDGHVIWSEYGPIEADVAMRLTQTARASALESVKGRRTSEQP